MSPTDTRLSVLRAEVERDWGQVIKHCSRACSADPNAGGPEAAFIALGLDHAYEAFEQMLLRIERALRLPERAGQHWHRAMLADAARALPGVRAPLLPAEAEADWEQLLGFRHFLRHAYAVELDGTRLQRNVERLQRAVALTAPAISDLLTALEREANGLG